MCLVGLGGTHTHRGIRLIKLLDDIEQDFPGFWETPIVKQGKEYRKTFFDKVNASLLLGRLAESTDDDDLVLVLPDDPTVLPLIIIESLLCLLKFDVLQSNNSNFLDQLSEGDSVMYYQDKERKGLPAVFQGVETYKNQRRYVVKCEEVQGKNSSMIYKCPEAIAHKKIKRCSRASSSKSRKTATIKGGNLEQRMGIDAGSLSSIQESKSLLVTGNKGKLKSEIQGITLDDDRIESIFPIGDYTDEKNAKPLLADKLDRDYILSFVSELDIATRIALDNSKFKLIIIDGASKIKYFYDDIRALNRDEHPRKIICLLRTTDEEEINELIRLGFSAWIWKKTDFRSITNTPAQHSLDTDFELHDALISKLVQAETSTYTIKETDINNTLVELHNSLNKLQRITPDSDRAGRLIKGFRRYLWFFRCLPITLAEHDDYYCAEGESFYERLNIFEGEVKECYGHIIPSNIQKDYDQSMTLIQQLHVRLKNSNPKRDKIIEILEQQPVNKPMTIICNDAETAEVLRNRWAINKSVKIVTQWDMDWRQPKDGVIICGYFSRKFMAKTLLAPIRECHFLLYDQEDEAYKNFLKAHPASPEAEVDKGIRKKYFPELQIKPTPRTINGLPKEDKASDVDSLWQLIDNKFEGAIDFGNSYDRYYKPSHTEISAYKIGFGDGCYTFVSKKPSLKRINRLESKIESVPYKHIELDDEIVFTDRSHDLLRSTLDEIKSQDPPRYKAQGIEINKWRTQLVSYVDKGIMTIDTIYDALKEAGCERSEATIKNWITGRTEIGPDEPEIVLPAIAKITRDTYLAKEENRLSIIKAFKKEKVLHIQVGRLLVREILRSTIQESEEDYNDLSEQAKSRIKEYADHARLKIVDYKSTSSQKVPDNAVGQLFTPGF